MDMNHHNGLSNQAHAEPIYSKNQMVYVKSREKDERQRELRVIIGLHTGVGPLGRQVLSIQLTDDDDPYFLHSLLVTSEDFKSLKVEQGLLVDFDHFPSQLIRLLEECSSSDRTGSRFNLILNEDTADNLSRKHTNLQFVETNEFKHLCHLSLRVIPGSDSEIKKHMSQKLKQLKDDLANTTSLLDQKCQMLKVACEKLELKSRELEENRLQVGEEKNNLERRLLQEIAEAREALPRAHLDWQKKLERERLEFEDIRNKEVKLLNDQLSESKLKNQILSEKLLHTESSVRDLAKHADSVEKELKAMQKENAAFKKQISQIDKDYHEKKSDVNTLRTKLAVLEQQTKDQHLLILKHQELLQNANEHKAKLEETVGIKEAALKRNQVTIKTLSDDLVKVNEMLSNQAKEISSLRSQVNNSMDVARSHKSKLEEMEIHLKEKDDRNEELKAKINQLNSTNKEIEKNLNKAYEMLEKKEKELKNKNDVIAYMNREASGAKTTIDMLRYRGGVVNSLTSSFPVPTTSTPNTATAPPPSHLLAASSVHANDASPDVFLKNQRDDMRFINPAMQKFCIMDPGVPNPEKPKSPHVPLPTKLDEAHLSMGKTSPFTLSSDFKEPRGKFVAGGVMPRPARHVPTTTTPAVKRADICSAYFQKTQQ